MAKIKVLVIKTYEVEINIPIEEIDYDVCQSEAVRLVEMEDSNIVFKGIESKGFSDIELTEMEQIEDQECQNEEAARWEKIEELQKEMNISNFTISLGKDSEEDILDDMNFIDDAGPYQIIYDGGWGNSYKSEIYHSPMLAWEDILVEASNAVEYSGDDHHIFLEAVNSEGMQDGVLVFSLKFDS